MGYPSSRLQDVRVLLVGEDGVGKTTLIITLVRLFLFGIYLPIIVNFTVERKLP